MNYQSPKKNQNEQQFQIWYCKIHPGIQLNLICTKNDCEQKGIICVNCLMQDHSEHFKSSIIPLSDFIQKQGHIQQNLSKSGILQSQQQLLQSQSKHNQSQSLKSQNSSQKAIQFLENMDKENKEFLEKFQQNKQQLLKTLDSIEKIWEKRISEIKSSQTVKAAQFKLTNDDFSSPEDIQQTILFLLENQNLLENDQSNVSQEFLKNRHNFLIKLFTDIGTDLQSNLNKNYKEALRTFRITPNRFQSPFNFDNFGYNKNKVDALSFSSLCENPVNICGFTFYQGQDRKRSLGQEGGEGGMGGGGEEWNGGGRNGMGEGGMEWGREEWNGGGRNGMGEGGMEWGREEWNGGGRNGMGEGGMGEGGMGEGGGMGGGRNGGGGMGEGGMGGREEWGRGEWGREEWGREEWGGEGAQEITQWPQNNQEINLEIIIYENNSDKLIQVLKENIKINQEQTIFEDNTTSIFFKSSVQLIPRKIYTLSLTTDQYFTTYSGTHGEQEIDIFRFETSRLSTNNTDVLQGIFPSFIYF